jgi:hypothetical protein
MVGVLAQTTEDFLTTSDVNTLTTAESTGLAAFLGAYLVFILALAVFYVVCQWKIFTKAGVPGWIALIPIYNYWKLCEIVGRPGWWSLSFLLSFIPLVGWIVPLVVAIIVMVDLAKSFGKEPIFALLLILLPIIGLPMLAFGSAKYGGPSANSGSKPAAPKAAA